MLSIENFMLQHVLKVFMVSTVSIYAHHFACNNLVIKKQGNVLVDAYVEHKDSTVNKVSLFVLCIYYLGVYVYKRFRRVRVDIYDTEIFNEAYSHTPIGIFFSVCITNLAVIYGK